MILYHYPHCPFCQRIRLFLGFKNIPYTLKAVPYSDKETPQELCGSSTLPIIDFEDGTIINESIDIIREIEHKFPHPIGFIGPVEARFQWSTMVMTSLPRYFDLLLPACADNYAEFTENPQELAYFQKIKEEKRGKTFSELKSDNAQIFESTVSPTLEEIIDMVEGEFFVMGPTFSVADCVLAADLSLLRIVEDINLPSEITQYIQRVESRCQVRLLES